MKKTSLWSVLLLGSFILLLMCGEGMASRIERVSVSTTGEQGGARSNYPSISSDGRYVAFESGATNLVADDTNGYVDVFVRDRDAPTTERVSVISGTSVGGNHSSGDPSISSDGRYVAFHSYASNLVPGDSEGKRDIFVHDRNTGITSMVSVVSGTTIGGNSNSSDASISADGRYVAFDSWASNLVPWDTEEEQDIFVHDRNTGITSRVSVESGTTQGGNGLSGYPSISGDGRYVAFYSGAANLVVGDTNGKADIFVHDLNTGATVRVSVSSAGAQGFDESEWCYISSNGRYVGFQSGATNLVANDTNGDRDTFVHDRDTDEDGIYDESGNISTTRISVHSDGTEGDGWSGNYGGGLTSDGRYVVFDSEATNLVDDDSNNASDIFIHDCLTGETIRVSVASDGSEGTGGYCEYSTITSDGRYVGFDSNFDNLVPNDTNNEWDVFVIQFLNNIPIGSYLLLFDE